MLLCPVRTIRIAVVATTLLVAGCGAGSGTGLDINGLPASGDDPGALTATFSSIQTNVFTPACTGCHAGSAAPLGLRLDQDASLALLVGIPSTQESGVLRVAAGDPDNSYLIQKLEGTAATGARMPLGLPPLPQATIDVIRTWIANGALDDAPVAGQPPAVVTTTPQAGAVVTALPAQVQVVLSAALDASLVSDLTVQLIRAGEDGEFDDGDDVVVTGLVSLSAANPALLLIDLGGIASIDDDYRLTLVGTGATALAGIDGMVLDGDGDGSAGGDFVVLFAVSSIEPTLEAIQAAVLTPSCAVAGCHSGPFGPDLPQGQDLSSAGASFASLVGVASVEVPSLERVTPGDAAASYLIQKLEGTAAVGAQMPLGATPLPWPTIDVIAQWINDGAPFDGEPADLTPPSVGIVPPASVLSGIVSVDAVAADNDAVAGVEFFVDAESIGSDTDAPYSVSWDTTGVTNGDHELLARATDAAGNSADSAPVTATVDNTPPDVTPPSVQLTAPVATEVSGLVTVAADAGDDVGVAEVRFFVDQLQLGVDTTAPYSIDWDTTLFVDGAYPLSASAIDTSGNEAGSAVLTVTVGNQPSNDTTAPSVTLTGPAPGVVSGEVSVSADANDDVGVNEVRFFANVDFIAADATAPYNVMWDSTALADGNVVLTAEAADAAGNVGFSAPVSVTIDNTAPTVAAVDPADGVMLDTFPAAVTVTFSESVAAATIDVANIALQASGGDGTFGDGNESDVAPASVTAPTPTTVAIDLAGVAGGDDTYQLTVTDAVTDVNGLALDGDGDSQPGGDFVSVFTVASPPTYTADVQPIFMQKCTPCHTGGGAGGHNVGSVYDDAFLPAGSCPGLNVGQCTIVRIQNGSMPRGRGCTGDPVLDAANPACLTQEEQDTVQAWIDAGLPE